MIGKASSGRGLSLFLAWELCVWLQNPFLVEVYFVVLSFHFIKALHIVQYNVCNTWQSIMAWFKLDTARGFVQVELCNL